MSYTPTNWQTGDTVTAEKLNNIEQGLFEVADISTSFTVILTPTSEDMSGIMDRSPQQIADAFNAGRRIFIYVPSMGGLTAEMTQFVPVDMGDGRTLYEAWGNFVYLNYNGIDLMITVKLRTDEYSPDGYIYDTSLHPLTPMS